MQRHSQQPSAETAQDRHRRYNRTFFEKNHFTMRVCPLTGGCTTRIERCTWQRMCMNKKRQAQKTVHPGTGRGDRRVLYQASSLDPRDHYCAVECDGTVPHEVEFVTSDYWCAQNS